MRNPPGGLSVVLLVLVASVALGQDRERLAVRTLLLSEHPAEATHRVYVKGQVATVLRFERPCDSAKLLGWEGRFEPLLVGGRKVVLEPLRDLSADESVHLLVTLVDGTEVPFLLRPSDSGEGRETDQQVNVFKDRESYAAMYAALHDALREKRALKEQVARYRKEETSEDHSLAALLASDSVKQTPFKINQHWVGKDEDAEVATTVFRGKGKAAVVFKIRNIDSAQAWSMKEARLLTVSGGQRRPVAIRSTQPSIPPGGAGAVAFVVDASAFIDEGTVTNLLLEIYRHDGLRHAYVLLDHRLAGD